MQGFLIEATILVACLVIALTAETTASALEDVFGENPRG
jgi:hypothetical protein